MRIYKNKLQLKLKDNMAFAILVILIFVFGLMSPNFLTIKNLMNICTQNSYLMIAAIGVGLVMISGGIDLSTGQCLSVVGVCIAVFMQWAGLPIYLAILLGIVIGVLLGFANGLAANLMQVHSMIATLATMTVFKGISYTISGSKTFFNFDQSYINIGQGYIGPISIPVIITFMVAAGIHLMLEMTCFGRFIYAVGGNQEAARLSGVNIQKVKCQVFVVAGGLYAIAAVILTARGGTANSSIGPGTEFDAIAACVLGGISFVGGEGRIRGIIIGCLILGILSNGMQLIGLGVYIQYIIKGIIMMLAIGYDTYSKRKRTRKINRMR